MLMFPVFGVPFRLGNVALNADYIAAAVNELGFWLY